MILYHWCHQLQIPSIWQHTSHSWRAYAFSYFFAWDEFGLFVGTDIIKNTHHKLLLMWIYWSLSRKLLFVWLCAVFAKPISYTYIFHFLFVCFNYFILVFVFSVHWPLLLFLCSLLNFCQSQKHFEVGVIYLVTFHFLLFFLYLKFLELSFCQKQLLFWVSLWILRL